MSATASYSVYYLVGFVVSLPVARLGIASWNWLAQISDALPSIPAEGDLFSSAALACVIAYLLTKTMPKQSEDHRDAMNKASAANEKLADKLEGMGNAIAAKIDEGNKEQMRYLRELSQLPRKQA